MKTILIAVFKNRNCKELPLVTQNVFVMMK